MVGLEQPQALVDVLGDVFGAAIDAAPRPVDDDAASCWRGTPRSRRPFSASASSASFCAGAVDPRGVEVVVAEVDRLLQQRDAFGVAGRGAIGPRNVHAPQAHGVERSCRQSYGTFSRRSFSCIGASASASQRCVNLPRAQ